MKKEARKTLRAAILEQLNDDMMPLNIGGHTVTDQLVFAGGSQWTDCGCDWDTSESAYAYIVDGEYQLTFPGDMFGFDGHNMIERQTEYYLQPDRSETPPCEPIGEPLRRVPDSILIEIAKGLTDAITAHEQEQSAQSQEAIALAARLAAK